MTDSLWLMDFSMPSFPVLHYLPEFAQTHVHWVGDTIQPSQPLLPLLLLPSIFPSSRLFSNELALCIRWSKYWSFSFSINSFNEYLVLTGLISLLSKRHLCVSSLKKQLVFCDGHESPLLFRLGISTKLWFFFQLNGLEVHYWIRVLSYFCNMLLGQKPHVMTINNV